MERSFCRLLSRVLLASWLLAGASHAQQFQMGPYDARFLAGGEGISERIDADSSLLKPLAAWTIEGWVRSDRTQRGPVLIGGFGNARTNGRYLAVRSDTPLLWIAGQEMSAGATLRAGEWHFLAATFDGQRAVLFVDGKAAASASFSAAAAEPIVQIAPTEGAWTDAAHFGGEVAAFTVRAEAVSADSIARRAASRPDFGLIHLADISVGWPWQVKQLTGMALPQAPATLPSAKAAFSTPQAKQQSQTLPLQAVTEDSWVLGNWMLAEAPRVSASAQQISAAQFDTTQWYQATVPGTVLTTLIDRGVYPDPDYGLNNMAIPESLARQDYWYRTEFPAPATSQSRLTLTFKGINYDAEVWLNGSRLGRIRGAFIRGIFDVTDKIHEGMNVLAVRISPPPHPGIPHEESIKAGPGENGGAMAIDGPTFIATEGWDWIPGIRDRDTGLWQNVVLSASGVVRIKDPHVITHLPLPRTDRADVIIDVPLENAAAEPMTVTLTAAFDQVRVRKKVTVGPGSTTVRLAPEEFRELSLAQPRLWWPNGYGAQDLYQLHLDIDDGKGGRDKKSLRFGVREITYELSLFDQDGELRRVEVSPTLGSLRGERLVDVRHEAIKKSPKGWAASLYPHALESPAVRALKDDALAPHLAIRVNGVRIASRGGNWGMDDSRKRIARERLEPYFRLHQEAHLNTIRNWVGLNYEDEFFDLADEYGMLVLSDFWASTQDFQVEPQDPQLFLANAHDTIARYRNHPSIALWFGRNEGVPQPILNTGLADLVAELDGTRHFTGSSNRVNLQGSGPYNYRPPSQYFTDLAQGYSVEVGTPSLATLESIKASIPAQDRWPISDTLAYHDWHHGGNGDVASFMYSLDAQFGAPTSLEDFERKAQMMNYVTYRAIFEGFQAHLWTRNSGRLLWMTHPAWPSNHWQIYSSDYETHASFYGVKKACEPVHAQMNLPDYSLAVVNTTVTARPDLSLRARVLGLDGRLFAEQRVPVTAAANAVTAVSGPDIAALVQRESLVLVKLELADTGGQIISGNLYWQGRDEAAYRRLNELTRRGLHMQAVVERSKGADARIHVRLSNENAVPLLANKLTLQGSHGERILPAYYSDNYVSLLPGESREIVISYPAIRPAGVSLAVRGWNTVGQVIAVR